MNDLLDRALPLQQEARAIGTEGGNELAVWIGDVVVPLCDNPDDPEQAEAALLDAEGEFRSEVFG